MAAAFKWYGQGIGHILKGTVDTDTDTFKIMLTSSAYTPNVDTHDFRDDITNELSGTGYTAGGQALASVVLAYDAPSNTWSLDFVDPTWTTTTLTGIRWGPIYKSRGGAASADELVGYADFDGDQSVTGGTFQIAVDASGALAVTIT